jgi:hypothetical protein
MNFAGQSAPWPSHGLSSIPVDAGTVLMHADNRRVDHLHSGITGASFVVHDPSRIPQTKIILAKEFTLA